MGANCWQRQPHARQPASLPDRGQVFEASLERTGALDGRRLIASTRFHELGMGATGQQVSVIRLHNN